jgi:hypothetical protein
MKKFLKIFMIVIAALTFIGFIGSLFDDKKAGTSPASPVTSSSQVAEAKEKIDASRLEEIKKNLEAVDDSTNFNAYFSEVERFANSNGPVAVEAKSFLKYREDYKFSMKQRSLKKWVDYAKIEFPKQFNSWDGSNKYLVDAIKGQMKDPSSFEHAETRYEYGSGYRYIRVRMTYRGKNSFNATTTETITTKMDIQGKILEVE